MHTPPSAYSQEVRWTVPLLEPALSPSPVAPRWQGALAQVIRQEPLIKTSLSLKGLELLPPGQAPRCVFIGLGLGTAERLSTAIPLDLLGVLLPAERIRRAINAPTLVVMIADRHALSNGFGKLQIQRRTYNLSATLLRIKDTFGLDRMELCKASDFHTTTEYSRILAEVERRAPARTHPYFKFEVADTCFMERVHRGLIKVGWTIRTSPTASTVNDELAFDRRLRRWTSLRAGFIYCAAGRALDDRRTKASPYICLNRERRICLSPDEAIREKVSRPLAHLSESTRRGVKNHLRKIGRCYCSVVTPIDGTWTRRTQAIIHRLYG